jgi:ribosome-associated protein
LVPTGRRRLDSLKLARQIVDAIAENKGEDVLLLDIREISILTDYFVIASTTSERQAAAIIDEIKKRAKKSLRATPLNVDGDTASQWVVLDYGGVVVHLLTQEMRDYYDLEGLWEDAAVVLRML